MLTYSCWFTNWPRTQRTKRKQRKRWITPDWYMAGLVSEESYLQGLFCGHKTSRSPHIPARILKVYIAALTGFSHAYLPYGLNTTFLFQDCFLGHLLGAGKANGAHIPATGEGERSFWLLESSLLANCSHGLSMTYPNIFFFITCYYNLLCPLFFCNVGHCTFFFFFTSIKVAPLVVIWLHWRQIPKQQYRYMQEKTQIKVMIPKTSNNSFR